MAETLQLGTVKVDTPLGRKLSTDLNRFFLRSKVGMFQHVEAFIVFGDMGVEPKLGGKTPKMDGENNGKLWKPYEQMDDLGLPLFLETPIFGSCHNTAATVNNEG